MEFSKQGTRRRGVAVLGAVAALAIYMVVAAVPASAGSPGASPGAPASTSSRAELRGPRGPGCFIESPIASMLGIVNCISCPSGTIAPAGRPGHA